MIDALVAVAVLGIGMTAGIRLFTVNKQATKWSRSRVEARAILDQRLELLSAQPVDQLPACAGPIGCRASETALRVSLPPAGPFQCTQTVDQMNFPDPNVPSLDGEYRIDTVVQAHPDATRQKLGAQIIAVSVCWIDDGGQAQEVRAERMLLPEGG